MSSSKNFNRLPKESTIVMLKSGHKILIGKEGNPAPAPTSHKLFSPLNKSENSKRGVILSKKCFK